MANLSRASLLLLNVWFFLFMTRTEFPAFGTLAGLSYLVRVMAGIILTFQLVYFHKLRISLKNISLALVFSAVFILSNAADPSLFTFIAGFCLFTGLMISGLSFRENESKILLRLVHSYMAVNLSGLVLGVFMYYGVGLEVDLHSLMFPWSAARVGEFMGFYRVTGFQIEPGTYTATM